MGVWGLFVVGRFGYGVFVTGGVGIGFFFELELTLTSGTGTTFFSTGAGFW